MGQQRDEAAAGACAESLDAEAARYYTRAGGGEAEVKKRPVVVDPGRAADFARMEKADADRGWGGGRVAWRNGRLAAFPSYQAEVERWDLVGPYLHEDRDGTWEEAKEGGGDACLRVDDQDRREKDRMDRAGSLDRSGTGPERGGVAWVDDRIDQDGWRVSSVQTFAGRAAGDLVKTP